MSRESIPRIGLGTFSKTDPAEWAENVRRALEVGYRHVDTAEAYGNETQVGDGIRAASVEREEVFVATKTVHFRETTDVATVASDIDACLTRLGVEYVDLLYVHWPGGVYEHDQVLPVFEAASTAGKTRHVGVCNFTTELLEEALQVLDVPLAAHQVEMHPLLQQPELLEHAQANDYWLVAYSPLAKGRVFENSVIRDIADERDCSPARVSLAWLLSKDNVAVVPKASSVEHMEDNLAAANLTLEASELRRIDSIEEEVRLVDPPQAPWNSRRS